uniref:Piwi domain-containing protein n=1 Tax=Panagrolaimus davidi TaxID=227884 RepID=A0A914P9F7_9BILA
MEVLEKPLEVKARVLIAPQVRYSNTSRHPEQKWKVREGVLIFDFKIAFDSARWEQCEHIVFDIDTKHHEKSKGFEQKYEVITQCVKSFHHFKVLTTSPLSLENVVAKANAKLGRLNYDIVLHDFPIESTVLSIGHGMNHLSSGMGNPQSDSKNASKREQSAADIYMVVVIQALFLPMSLFWGIFCANDGVSPNEFNGNFFFSPMYRDGKLSVLDILLEETLERFQTNRGSPLSRII